MRRLRVEHERTAMSFKRSALPVDWRYVSIDDALDSEVRVACSQACRRKAALTLLNALFEAQPDLAGAVQLRFLRG